MSGGDSDVAIAFGTEDASLNRIWLRIPAEQGEHVWGGGEQSRISTCAAVGSAWTSEPGVGRDKTTEITFKSDVTGSSGGDWLEHQLSAADLSLLSALCAARGDHGLFGIDFRNDDFHEVEIWAVPERIEFTARPTFIALVEAMAERFGRQRLCPTGSMAARSSA